jgi:hypothetical protein
MSEFWRGFLSAAVGMVLLQPFVVAALDRWSERRTGVCYHCKEPLAESASSSRPAWRIGPDESYDFYVPEGQPFRLRFVHEDPE